MSLLPVAGDIVRTRIVRSVFARAETTSFYWKILEWSPSVSLDDWCFDVVSRYMLSLSGWVNQDWLITCCKFKNLTSGVFTVDLPMFVQGPDFFADTPVCQSTVWVSRWGKDASGFPRSSLFPISTLFAPETDGRVNGDGQPPQLEDFLVSEQLFAPLFPVRWYGGFIDNITGSFIRTLKAKTNPVLTGHRKRSRKGMIQMQRP